MSGIQKLFLKRVRSTWQRDFPFLMPVNLQEIPLVQKGSTFVCADFFAERGRAYFIRIDFSQKRHGEFSLGITVSDSLTRSIREHGLETPSPSALGMYAIGQFVPAQTRRWALIDRDAEVDEFFRSLGQEPVGLAQMRSAYCWYPPSFELPQSEIFDGAISDVGAVLKEHVFPKLEIPCLR
jgi:hypothetical protein